MLYKDVRLHWRWKAEFKHRKALDKQWVASKACGGRDGSAEVDALRVVLKTCWEWFVAEGGHACPFDLDD